MNRVQRAFYQFEVYCNLFRDLKVLDSVETGDMFLFNSPAARVSGSHAFMIIFPELYAQYGRSASLVQIQD